MTKLIDGQLCYDDGAPIFSVGAVLGNKHKCDPNPKKYWLGKIPNKCDICGEGFTDILIDGRTTHGPWANMCRACHGSIGCGIGNGNGQVYDCNTGEKLRG